MLWALPAAVALDACITAQRNWYHVASNGEYFIKFILEKIKQARREVSSGKKTGVAP